MQKKLHPLLSLNKLIMRVVPFCYKNFVSFVNFCSLNTLIPINGDNSNNTLSESLSLKAFVVLYTRKVAGSGCVEKLRARERSERVFSSNLSHCTHCKCVKLAWLSDCLFWKFTEIGGWSSLNSDIGQKVSDAIRQSNNKHFVWRVLRLVEVNNVITIVIVITANNVIHFLNQKCNNFLRIM